MFHDSVPSEPLSVQTQFSSILLGRVVLEPLEDADEGLEHDVVSCFL